MALWFCQQLPLLICFSIYTGPFIVVNDVQATGVQWTQNTYDQLSRATSFDKNYVCDVKVSDFVHCARLNRLMNDVSHLRNDLRLALKKISEVEKKTIEKKDMLDMLDVEGELRDEVRTKMRSELIYEFSNKILIISSQKSVLQADRIGNVSRIYKDYYNVHMLLHIVCLICYLCYISIRRIKIIMFLINF